VIAANEKAAGMLDTSGAAQETTQHREFTPDQKQLATLIDQFANAGHTVAQVSVSKMFDGPRVVFDQYS
jgi:hypothetical protein